MTLDLSPKEYEEMVFARLMDVEEEERKLGVGEGRVKRGRIA